MTLRKLCENTGWDIEHPCSRIFCEAWYQWIQINKYLRQMFGCGRWRSSHQRCSIETSVLRNFTKLTGKHLCQSPFFNKVVGLSFPSIYLEDLHFKAVFKHAESPPIQNIWERDRHTDRQTDRDRKRDRDRQREKERDRDRQSKKEREREFFFFIVRMVIIF